MATILPLSRSSLREVGAWLQKGEVCALPTETVYGLAGNAYDRRAILKIFALKKRPFHNPLIVHYPSLSAAQKDGLFCEKALVLAQQFWPGPLTLIVPRAPGSKVCEEVGAGLNTLAIRVPASSFLKELMVQEQMPLAAPSANRAGHISPSKPQHALSSLLALEVIVDGGPCKWGLESTVVDTTTSPFTLLRPGALLQEDLESFLHSPLNAPLFHGGLGHHCEPNKGPGLLSSHYAPRQPLRMDATFVLPEEGLLAFGTPHQGARVTLNLSASSNLEEAAFCLFSHLYELECHPVTGIAVMPIPSWGMGLAINNRLRRASAQDKPGA